MERYAVIKQNKIDLNVQAGNNIHDVLLNTRINLQDGMYSRKHLCKLCVCVRVCLGA